jgi:hypothetical protein
MHGSYSLKVCPNGSISKIVMKDVPSDPIGGSENTLSFPGEETSLDSGLPSHLPLVDVPCPSSPSYGFLHHTMGSLRNAWNLLAITVLEMLTVLTTRLTSFFCVFIIG